MLSFIWIKRSEDAIMGLPQSPSPSSDIADGPATFLPFISKQEFSGYVTSIHMDDI